MLEAILMEEPIMNKQQFIATIPILDEKTLKRAAYIYADYPERGAVESRFPAIPMIRHNIDPTAEISVIVIFTQAGNYKHNLELFYEELQAVSDEFNVELVSKVTEIPVPYEETKKKHTEFFVSIGNALAGDADLYMDLTYGSKVSPITEFASLVYAEHAKKCRIKEVIYGKVMGSETPTLYDIKELYRMSQLINTMSFLPNANLEKLLNSFNEDEK